MPEQKYFKQALANFAFDMAGGDAVRHLADRGCTVKQIIKLLTFPMPYEKVREIVWKHLTDTEVILQKEPGSKEQKTAGTYIKEYDAFGKPSFRFSPSGSDKEIVFFREIKFQETHKINREDGLEVQQEIFRAREQEFFDYLTKKCRENGEEKSYISCNFGLYYTKKDLFKQESSEQKECLKELSLLDTNQQDYILGLPWESGLCYHRMDRRIREITAKLYAGGAWNGTCYFLKSEEKVIFL